MTICPNPDATFTAAGELTDVDSATILTSQQNARILEARLVSESGLTLQLLVGGAAALQPSPVTYEGTIENIVVQNADVTVETTGTGTGYYTVTYEFM